MRIKRYYILLTLLLSSVSFMYSQERSLTDIYVEFLVNNSVLDPNFGDNATHLDEIISLIDKINTDTTLSVVKLSFCGSASPEGSLQLNRGLSYRRLKALEQYVRSRVYIPDSVITYDASYIPWNRLRERVLDMDLDKKQEVLDIIDKDEVYVNYRGNTQIDGRVVELMNLDKSAVWRQLSKAFQEMRSAYVVFELSKQLPRITLEAERYNVTAKAVLRDTIICLNVEPYVEVHPEEYRHLHLATNLPAWGLLLSNATLEVDLSRHWSLALPVYYSALNYFADDVKFRTITMQPELRYWFRGCESSWYAGAHAGLSYYNVAWGELFRYQDHNMNTPALGGGLSIGYRKPIGSNKRWCLDISVGAGVYSVHYDRFINIENGFLVDSKKMTYAGVDHAALSLSYMFDIAKRKRR